MRQFSKLEKEAVRINQNELKSIITDAKLFKNTSEETISYVVNNGKIFSCKKGDKIFDTESDCSSLFLIIYLLKTSGG